MGWYTRILLPFLFLVFSSQYATIVGESPWSNPSLTKDFMKMFLVIIPEFSCFTSQQLDDIKTTTDTMINSVELMMGTEKNCNSVLQALNAAFASSVAEIAMTGTNGASLKEKIYAIEYAMSQALLITTGTIDKTFINEILQLLNVFSHISLSLNPDGANANEPFSAGNYGASDATTTATAVGGVVSKGIYGPKKGPGRSGENGPSGGGLHEPGGYGVNSIGSATSAAMSFRNLYNPGGLDVNRPSDTGSYSYGADSYAAGTAASTTSIGNVLSEPYGLGGHAGNAATSDASATDVSRRPYSARGRSRGSYGRRRGFGRSDRIVPFGPFGNRKRLGRLDGREPSSGIFFTPDESDENSAASTAASTSAVAISRKLYGTIGGIDQGNKQSSEGRYGPGGLDGYITSATISTASATGISGEPYDGSRDSLISDGNDPSSEGPYGPGEPGIYDPETSATSEVGVSGKLYDSDASWDAGHYGSYGISSYRTNAAASAVSAAGISGLPYDEGRGPGESDGNRPSDGEPYYRNRGARSQYIYGTSFTTAASGASISDFSGPRRRSFRRVGRYKQSGKRYSQDEGEGPPRGADSYNLDGVDDGLSYGGPYDKDGEGLAIDKGPYSVDTEPYDKDGGKPGQYVYGTSSATAVSVASASDFSGPGRRGVRKRRRNVPSDKKYHQYDGEDPQTDADVYRPDEIDGGLSYGGSYGKDGEGLATDKDPDNLDAEPYNKDGGKQDQYVYGTSSSTAVSVASASDFSGPGRRGVRKRRRNGPSDKKYHQYDGEDPQTDADVYRPDGIDGRLSYGGSYGEDGEGLATDKDPYNLDAEPYNKDGGKQDQYVYGTSSSTAVSVASASDFSGTGRRGVRKRGRNGPPDKKYRQDDGEDPQTDADVYRPDGIDGGLSYGGSYGEDGEGLATDKDPDNLDAEPYNKDGGEPGQSVHGTSSSTAASVASASGFSGPRRRSVRRRIKYEPPNGRYIQDEEGSLTDSVTEDSNGFDGVDDESSAGEPYDKYREGRNRDKHGTSSTATNATSDSDDSGSGPGSSYEGPYDKNTDRNGTYTYGTNATSTSTAEAVKISGRRRILLKQNVYGQSDKRPYGSSDKSSPTGKSLYGPDGGDDGSSDGSSYGKRNGYVTNVVSLANAASTAEVPGPKPRGRRGGSRKQNRYNSGLGLNSDDQPSVGEPYIADFDGRSPHKYTSSAVAANAVSDVAGPGETDAYDANNVAIATGSAGTSGQGPHDQEVFASSGKTTVEKSLSRLLSPSSFTRVSSAASTLASYGAPNYDSLSNIISNLSSSVAAAHPGLPNCEHYAQVLLEVISALVQVLDSAIIRDVDTPSSDYSSTVVSKSVNSAFDR